MMDAFGSIGRTAEARGLIDLSASHSLPPDTMMFNAALRCCQSYEEIKVMQHRMSSAGIKGNRATIRLLERARDGADLSRNYGFFRY
mmetsp:Transcript_69671/g.102078  ORF Transcript_69671/g.102078 Transcript_69671/m.102078 type:complete len:87 (+) Transcript_69671:103-363(+)